jgi:formate hydrogenlyase subunit 3/multisubunit Na+/H+ antiporter MnhD subunit
MSATAILLAEMAALLALVPAGLAVGRAALGRWVVYGGALVICAAAAATAAADLLGLTQHAGGDLVLPLGLPWIGARFHLDALSDVFLVVVDAGGTIASLYALGYGRHEPEPGRVLPFYPAFLAGMNLVLLAADAFSFLVAWEVMSLASWALVVARHREPENLRAGYVYLVMASFGAFSLLLAFGLLAGPQGAYAFEAMRAHPPGAATAALTLVLVVLGAGSKAGLVPLHVWLPLAHPAAPSHVSALMSGVMTKVAVYAFVRIVFDLAGPPAWWWSLPVLALGAATAVIGVLQATLQADLKRILAFSTVENIGVVFVGLGLALAFKAQHMALPAALSMTAALLHVFNHSLFKSLLFFGAGAVQHAAGERDIEQLGGLIRRMPQTALAVLGGCLAISALPPLNGFVSEWLTFQAILVSPGLNAPALKLMVPTVGALLALAAALAAACFVRVYGIAFLGRPRSPAAQSAHETDAVSRAAMLLLAGACLAIGLLPGAVIDALGPAARATVGAQLPTQVGTAWNTIVPIAETRSSYNGALVLAFIAASAAACALAIHQFASRQARRAPAWDGGTPDHSPLTQYTAASFAQPIRRVFASSLLGAREQVDMPRPGDPRPARFEVVIRDPIWDVVYAPIARAIGFAADRLNKLQFLTIRLYLSLVFFALIALLLVLALWS